MRKVRINVEKRPGVIIIAQRAVQELQGKNFVWVVDNANKVSQRQVTVGSRFGSDWIIEDGLKPGEHIVVEGLQKVREGALVQPSTAAPTPPVTAAANLTKE
jgi:membrane fusion protein, multidrug efflux system